MKALLRLLTPYHFNELQKQGLSLDHIYLLLCIQAGADMRQFASKKGIALMMTLERRFLITEEGKVSTDGEKVLTFLETSAPEDGALQLQESVDEFEEWWKAYPSTDTVIVEGRILYKGTRSLRGKKEEARDLFRKVLAEGYTLDQLLKALRYEVKLKIERSVKERENKLRYMLNSSSYLRQRTFASFIDIAEMEEKAPAPAKQSAGTVDI